MLKKDFREDACLQIARFMYNNAISFNVVKSEEFHKMCESIARHGLGFKPPSYHEIRIKYLKQEVASTMAIIEEHKVEWKKSGCTIISDGWTDKRRRTICNFLVNSRKGTVFLKSIDASHISKTADKIFKMLDDIVEEVGEENVVQVVTDNAANYKAAGQLLMQKRTKLYWTPCAAHCIDLMLEDFEKLKIHHETISKGKKLTTYIYSRTSLISMLQQFTKGKDLIRPAMTRFATSYLTLNCLLEQRGALVRMFTSEQWTSSKNSKTRDGKSIENVALDSRFWKGVGICLKSASPLIKVLRLVDSDEQAAMGFIYEELDRAKESIALAFKGVKKSYMPLWDIIDERWDKQLHRPLHAAAYFLNPQNQYSPNFKADREVIHGLYECLNRMVGNDTKISEIDVQIDDFKHSRKFFGSAVAKNAINRKHPADWWDSFGFDHPELRDFAIRILSLTCSSSGCERNWSAFEMVHTKRRNRLKQQTMNDVVFVMTNSKLGRKKHSRKDIEYNIEDLSSDDEWIVDNDSNAHVNEELGDVEIDNVGMNVPIPMDDDYLNNQFVDDVVGSGDASLDIDDLEVEEDDDQHDDNEDDGDIGDEDLDDGLNEFLKAFFRALIITFFV